MSKLVSVGQIVNVHGVKGVVKIKPYLLSPHLIGTLNPLTDSSGRRTFDLKPIGRKKECLLAQIAGITDRTAAEALKGTELFALKSKLPATRENEFYYADLIGLTVLRDGQPIGSVSRVDNFGAGDVVEVKLQNDRTVSFGFSRETFPRVDLTAGVMDVVVPLGMEDAL